MNSPACRGRSRPGRHRDGHQTGKCGTDFGYEGLVKLVINQTTHVVCLDHARRPRQRTSTYCTPVERNGFGQPSCIPVRRAPDHLLPDDRLNRRGRAEHADAPGAVPQTSRCARMQTPSRRPAQHRDLREGRRSRSRSAPDGTGVCRPVPSTASANATRSSSSGWCVGQWLGVPHPFPTARGSDPAGVQSTQIP